MVRLEGVAQEKPDEGARSEDGLEVRMLQATDDGYDGAHRQLLEQLGDGWRLLWIRRVEG